MTGVDRWCWAVPSLDYVDMHSSTRVPGKAAPGSDTHVVVRLKTLFRLLIGLAESRQHGYTWRSCFFLHFLSILFSRVPVAVCPLHLVCGVRVSCSRVLKERRRVSTL